MKTQLTYENYNYLRDNASNTNYYKSIYNLAWNTFKDGDYQDMIRIILDFECTRLRNKYYRKYSVREGFTPSLLQVYEDVQEFILTLYSIFEIDDNMSIDFFTVGFIDVLFCKGLMFSNIVNLLEENTNYGYDSGMSQIYDNISSMCEYNDIAAIYVYEYLKYLYDTAPSDNRDELVIFDRNTYDIEGDDISSYFNYLKGDLLFYVYNV